MLHANHYHLQVFASRCSSVVWSHSSVLSSPTSSYLRIIHTCSYKKVIQAPYHLFIYLSIYLSDYPPIYLSIYESIYSPCIYRNRHSSIYLPINTHLSIYPFIIYISYPLYSFDRGVHSIGPPMPKTNSRSGITRWYVS